MGSGVGGLGQLRRKSAGGTRSIIDGNRGVVIVNRRRAVGEPRRVPEEAGELDAELRELLYLPAETLDGHVVSLQANIERRDVDDALTRGAQGIGLYRTNFFTSRARRSPGSGPL